MAITNVIGLGQTQDTFGWTFRDSGGTELFSVRFVPNLGGPTNGNGDALRLTAGVYDGGVLIGGLDNFDIFYDAIYDLTVSIPSAGTASVALTDAFNVTTTIYSGTVAGATPNLISDAAATWSLPGLVADYGNNGLLFNDYSLIPEPTSALFAVGLLAVTAGRRSRSRRS